MPLERVNKLNYDNILDFNIFPYPSTEFHTFPGLHFWNSLPFPDFHTPWEPCLQQILNISNTNSVIYSFLRVSVLRESLLFQLPLDTLPSLESTPVDIDVDININWDINSDHMVTTPHTVFEDDWLLSTDTLLHHHIPTWMTQYPTKTHW